MKKKSTFYTVLSIILASVMLISLVSCVGNSSKLEDIKWSELELGSILPSPDSDKGKVYTNSNERLYVGIAEISEEQYKNYIDICKENGFTVEIEERNYFFDAYNENGYKIELGYYQSNSEMSITIEAPMEVNTFEWPKSDIASLLPIPESNIGKIDWEASYGFVIYVAETPIEKYNSYVNACWENGFTINYSKGDDFFYADNKEGYRIQLKYEGNNIMFIRIDKPSETTSDISSTTSLTTKAADTTATTTTASTAITSTVETSTTSDVTISDNIIRPEFKEAMDSYEAFFDEYIAFMKEFETSSDITLLVEYSKFLSQYTETMSKLDAMSEEEMTNAELLYYIEVMNRIEEKLAAAAITM